MELLKQDDYYSRNANGSQGTMRLKGGFNEALSTMSNSKGNRSNAMEASIVTVNGIQFDADESSLDRLNRIVSLANAEFNYKISVGVTLADAYKTTYKDQKITWIGVDNKPHTVQIESIMEVLKSGMDEMGTIWMNYR